MVHALCRTLGKMPEYTEANTARIWLYSVSILSPCARALVTVCWDDRVLPLMRASACSSMGSGPPRHCTSCPRSSAEPGPGNLLLDGGWLSCCSATELSSLTASHASSQAETLQKCSFSIFLAAYLCRLQKHPKLVT